MFKAGEERDQLGLLGLADVGDPSVEVAPAALAHELGEVVYESG
ncbi:hypothetical protein QFZ82_000514 [Streptomyces sp. V4I23]|nr:hypothetical protein [Streptomyces sp. V4I23]MDQ1006029.1 hypothetical protein [Streptomyces sp. V4I23]